MIILKHRYTPEPEHWKFACKCGCEWVSDDETEMCKKYRDSSGVFTSCRCPECDDVVYSRCLISSEEYDKIYNKAFNEVGLQLIKITKEEKPF